MNLILEFQFPCAPRRFIYKIQDRQCHILLQNENGPCPLIAAANALILRGAITLESSAIRASVIGTEDLVQTLADWALHRMSATSPAVTDATAGADPSQLEEDVRSRKIQQQQHVNEVMEMLPNLQFGLDVNPKFTNGPDGCEVSLATMRETCLNV